MKVLFPRAVREFLNGLNECASAGRELLNMRQGDLHAAMSCMVERAQNELKSERAVHEEEVRRLSSKLEFSSARVQSLKEQLSAETAARKEAERKLGALTLAIVEYRENINTFADDLREDKASANHVDACDYSIGILDMILRRDGITIPESLDATEKADV